MASGQKTEEKLKEAITGQLAVPAAATYSTKKECKLPAEEGNRSCDDASDPQLIRLAVAP
jgi:hypothetical protein